jgi:hypothetical protein
MNEERSKQLKIFGVIGAVVILVVAAVFVASKAIDAGKNATLAVMVAPNSAKITVGGTEYKNGIYRLKPQGLQDVTIEADGFQSESMTVDISSNEVATIQLVLKPSNNDYSVYLENLKDYDSLKLNAETKEAKEFIRKKEDSFSLFELFPLHMTDSDFDPLDTSPAVMVTVSRATDSEACPQVNCIRVSANGGQESSNLETAKYAIRQKGYNPEDYRYYYVEE